MPDDAPREDEHKPEPGVPGPAERRSERERSAETEATRTDVGDPVGAALVAQFEGAVFHESHGQPVVYLDRSRWAEAAAFLRDDQQFTMLLDLTAVDHLVDVERISVAGVDPERFEVVANFISHPRNRRIRLITEVPAGDTVVPSLAPTYPSAEAAEREVYDLFGITFAGHPELTRILMPDDWVGHPLRKDDAPSRVPVTFKEDPGPR
jgi:NADH:ubiquinone oxidoreductase subunit C